MIRLFGFIVGAALAIAAILLVLGVPELAPEPAAQTTPVDPAPLPEAPDPVPEPESQSPEPVVAAQPEPEPLPMQPEPAYRDVIDPQWHSFWSPFGSQIAANGFVSRLEAVTGYDYRVIKVDTGVYEVTFAYTTDDERREKLANIATATGLEIPGS